MCVCVCVDNIDTQTHHLKRHNDNDPYITTTTTKTTFMEQIWIVNGKNKTF